MYYSVVVNDVSCYNDSSSLSQLV